MLLKATIVMTATAASTYAVVSWLSAASTCAVTTSRATVTIYAAYAATSDTAAASIRVAVVSSASSSVASVFADSLLLKLKAHASFKSLDAEIQELFSSSNDDSEDSFVFTVSSPIPFSAHQPFDIPSSSP